VERRCEGEVVSVRVCYQGEIGLDGVQGDGSTALEICPLPGVKGSVES
jgi:hypothetical protein